MVETPLLVNCTWKPRSVASGDVTDLDAALARVEDDDEAAPRIRGRLTRRRHDHGGDLEGNKELIVKELGDVMWYVSAICDELGVSMEDVARTNIKKLEDRQQRGVLGGNGDNR